MPEPLAIAASVGGRLAGALVGPPGAKLKQEAIGSEDARAVDWVCREAVEEAVRRLPGDLEEGDIVHVLTLLDDALAVRGTAGLDVDGWDAVET